MDVIKEREGKRTVYDKGERGHGCNKGEREKEPWMIKERENMEVIKEREGKRTNDEKGGSERNITPLSRLWNREGLCGLLQDGNRRGEDMNSLSHDSYRRQEA